MTEKKSAPERVRFMLIAHTHWDREWYLPFEIFRHRLVNLIDKLIEIMQADPDYKSFHLDGQTIALADYERIRGRSEPLRDLICQGRIKVGPWHALPDEFLVSGEALVRNLLRGREVCRDFGAEPLQIGYLPDMFGHVAQMPQILAGMGLGRAVAWRGVPPGAADQKFDWQAPDGTRVFACYLPLGYGFAAGLPHNPELMAERLDALLEEVGTIGGDNLFLLLAGADHTEPDPEILETLKQVPRIRPGWTFEFTDWEQWMEALKKTGPAKAAMSGELRSTAQTLILPGVASARLYLKKLDFILSTELERHAEPLAALSRALGGPDYSDEIDYAWDLLIQNHPHDSICGCSIDQVHDEMETRYHKAIQLAKRISGLALGRLAGEIGDGRPALLVHNPAGAQTPAIISGAIEGRVKKHSVLVDKDGASYPLQVLDTVAREKTLMDFTVPRRVALMILGDMISAESFGLYLQRVRQKVKQDTLELRVEVGTTPPNIDLEAAREAAELAMADPSVKRARFMVIRLSVRRAAAVVPCLPGPSVAAFGLAPWRGPRAASLETGPDWVENEKIKLLFEPGGTCLLTDKASGIGYRLLRFLDVADRGDSYNFDPLPDDNVICEMNRVTLKSITTGPVAAVMEIRHRMRVPESLHKSREARSKKKAPIDLFTSVTVYKDSPRVDFRTRFVNTAKDHRLQTAVRIPYQADTIKVETPFAMVHRPIVDDSPPDADRKKDLAYQLLGGEGVYAGSPHKTLCLVTNGDHGLAVMNRGMAEVEAIRLPGATRVALTMVRSVGWLSRGDLNMRRGNAGPMLEAPGAQCLREFEWDYAVAPVAGGPDGALALSMAHAFAYPPRLALVRSGAGGVRGSLPLLEIDNPRVYVSALRPLPGGAVEARLVNASGKAQDCEAGWGSWWKGDMVTDLKGDPAEVEGAEISERRLKVELRPYQIFTFRLVPS